MSEHQRALFSLERKYVLDLFTEASMLGCRPVVTLMEQNHRICADAGELVDKKRSKTSWATNLFMPHSLMHYLCCECSKPIYA